jgi:hypothetical protein
MSGAIPPLSQYAFMAWCLVKTQGQFSFTLRLQEQTASLSSDYPLFLIPHSLDFSSLDCIHTQQVLFIHEEDPLPALTVRMTESFPPPNSKSFHCNFLFVIIYGHVYNPQRISAVLIPENTGHGRQWTLVRCNL